MKATGRAFYETYRDTFGIHEHALRLVVAVMSAEKLGMPPVTAKQVYAMTGLGEYAFAKLVRARWLERVHHGIPHTYRAHPRAWKELGVEK